MATLDVTSVWMRHLLGSLGVLSGSGTDVSADEAFLHVAVLTRLTNRSPAFISARGLLPDLDGATDAPASPATTPGVLLGTTAHSLASMLSAHVYTAMGGRPAAPAAAGAALVAWAAHTLSAASVPVHDPSAWTSGIVLRELAVALTSVHGMDEAHDASVALRNGESSSGMGRLAHVLVEHFNVPAQLFIDGAAVAPTLSNDAASAAASCMLRTHAQLCDVAADARIHMLVHTRGAATTRPAAMDVDAPLNDCGFDALFFTSLYSFDDHRLHAASPSVPAMKPSPRSICTIGSIVRALFAHYSNPIAAPMLSPIAEGDDDSDDGGGAAQQTTALHGRTSSAEDMATMTHSRSMSWYNFRVLLQDMCLYPSHLVADAALGAVNEIDAVRHSWALRAFAEGLLHNTEPHVTKVGTPGGSTTTATAPAHRSALSQHGFLAALAAATEAASPVCSPVDMRNKLVVLAAECGAGLRATFVARCNAILGTASSPRNVPTAPSAALSRDPFALREVWAALSACGVAFARADAVSSVPSPPRPLVATAATPPRAPPQLRLATRLSSGGSDGLSLPSPSATAAPAALPSGHILRTGELHPVYVAAAGLIVTADSVASPAAMSPVTSRSRAGSGAARLRLSSSRGPASPLAATSSSVGSPTSGGAYPAFHGTDLASARGSSDGAGALTPSLLRARAQSTDISPMPSASGVVLTEALPTAEEAAHAVDRASRRRMSTRRRSVLNDSAVASPSTEASTHAARAAHAAVASESAESPAAAAHNSAFAQHVHASATESSNVSASISALRYASRTSSLGEHASSSPALLQPLPASSPDASPPAEGSPRVPRGSPQSAFHVPTPDISRTMSTPFLAALVDAASLISPSNAQTDTLMQADAPTDTHMYAPAASMPVLSSVINARSPLLSSLTSSMDALAHARALHSNLAAAPMSGMSHADVHITTWSVFAPAPATSVSSPAATAPPSAVHIHVPEQASFSGDGDFSSPLSSAGGAVPSHTRADVPALRIGQHSHTAPAWSSSTSSSNRGVAEHVVGLITSPGGSEQQPTSARSTFTTDVVAASPALARVRTESIDISREPRTLSARGILAERRRSVDLTLLASQRPLSGRQSSTRSTDTSRAPSASLPLAHAHSAPPLALSGNMPNVLLQRASSETPHSTAHPLVALVGSTHAHDVSAAAGRTVRSASSASQPPANLQRSTLMSRAGAGAALRSQSEDIGGAGARAHAPAAAGAPVNLTVRAPITPTAAQLLASSQRQQRLATAAVNRGWGSPLSDVRGGTHTLRRIVSAPGNGQPANDTSSRVNDHQSSHSAADVWAGSLPRAGTAGGASSRASPASVAESERSAPPVLGRISSARLLVHTPRVNVPRRATVSPYASNFPELNVTFDPRVNARKMAPNTIPNRIRPCISRVRSFSDAVHGTHRLAESDVFTTDTGTWVLAQTGESSGLASPTASDSVTRRLPGLLPAGSAPAGGEGEVESVHGGLDLTSRSASGAISSPMSARSARDPLARVHRTSIDETADANTSPFADRGHARADRLPRVSTLSAGASSKADMSNRLFPHRGGRRPSAPMTVFRRGSDGSPATVASASGVASVSGSVSPVSVNHHVHTTAHSPNQAHVLSQPSGTPSSIISDIVSAASAAALASDPRSPVVGVAARASASSSRNNVPSPHRLSSGTRKPAAAPSPLRNATIVADDAQRTRASKSDADRRPPTSQHMVNVRLAMADRASIGCVDEASQSQQERAENAAASPLYPRIRASTSSSHYSGTSAQEAPHDDEEAALVQSAAAGGYMTSASGGNDGSGAGDTAPPDDAQLQSLLLGVESPATPRSAATTSPALSTTAAVQHIAARRLMLSRTSSGSSLGDDVPGSAPASGGGTPTSTLHRVLGPRTPVAAPRSGSSSSGGGLNVSPPTASSPAAGVPTSSMSKVMPVDTAPVVVASSFGVSPRAAPRVTVAAPALATVVEYPASVDASGTFVYTSEAPPIVHVASSTTLKTVSEANETQSTGTASSPKSQEAELKEQRSLSNASERLDRELGPSPQRRSSADGVAMQGSWRSRSPVAIGRMAAVPTPPQGGAAAAPALPPRSPARGGIASSPASLSTTAAHTIPSVVVPASVISSARVVVGVEAFDGALALLRVLSAAGLVPGRIPTPIVLLMYAAASTSGTLDTDGAAPGTPVELAAFVQLCMSYMALTGQTTDGDDADSAATGGDSWRVLDAVRTAAWQLSARGAATPH